MTSTKSTVTWTKTRAEMTSIDNEVSRVYPLNFEWFFRDCCFRMAPMLYSWVSSSLGQSFFVAGIAFALVKICCQSWLAICCENSMFADNLLVRFTSWPPCGSGSQKNGFMDRLHGTRVKPLPKNDHSYVNRIVATSPRTKTKKWFNQHFNQSTAVISVRDYDDFYGRKYYSYKSKTFRGVHHPSGTSSPRQDEYCSCSESPATSRDVDLKTLDVSKLKKSFICHNHHQQRQDTEETTVDSRPTRPPSPSKPRYGRSSDWIYA